MENTVQSYTIILAMALLYHVDWGFLVALLYVLYTFQNYIYVNYLGEKYCMKA